MKCRSFILLGVTAMGVVAAAPAYSGCGPSQTGYLYVWASCTQSRVSKPDNVCEIDSRSKRAVENVLFISNVIADNGSNSRYPHSGFFDAIKIQHNRTENGRESFCYRSRSEAEDERDKMIADRKRSDYIIRHVQLRDH